MAKNPSRKWAVHAEWCFERQGLPMKVVTRVLRVHARTVTDWDRGSRPIPHWAPQVLRLHRMDKVVMLAQMTGQDAVPLKGLAFIDPPVAGVRMAVAMAA